MANRVGAALCCVLFSALSANCQESKDAIDKSLDACLASGSGASTAGQSECASKAYAAWDAELNKTFQKLMGTLDPGAREMLRASQRQWLTFLNAEKKLQAALARRQGTLGAVSASLASVEILKSRVLTLRSYLSSGNLQ